ncbi:MAG: TauD/TfdA family dioxygenase [Solirubrobacteraceae bacterium]|nr:TauD/TfdA family dioxygenase [Solirubrobacteraceae bacterium]
MKETGMDITPTGALGARVKGLAIGPLDEAVTTRLRLALAEHGVLAFRDPSADDAAFTAFMDSFGPAVFTDGETPVAGHPTLNVVSNVGRTTPPRSVFHIDTSYVSTPPAYTALRAVQLPEEGGETVFSDQFEAYDRLGDDTRRRLRHALVTHEASGMAIPDGEERRARHPLFLRHAHVDRTSLYLSTPARCTEVSGLDAEHARAEIEALYEHSIAPPYALRHRWVQGDVVIWDNRRTLHRADHSGVVGDRVLHRAMSIDAAA